MFSSSKKYSILVFLFLFGLITISGYVFYQMWPRYTKNYSMIPLIKQPHTIYLLNSKDNLELFFSKMNLSSDNYLNNIKKFKQKLTNLGYEVKVINENKIASLKPHDILIAFDEYAISNKHFKELKEFIKKGGNFIFNYHFGYLNENKFLKAKRIEEITNLKLLKETISKDDTLFFIPKLLSPVGMSSQNARRYDIVLYGNDVLPLFESKTTPDAILTNWSVTATPLIKNHLLDINKSGVMWHGLYGKGKWFYISMPLYVFLDMPKDEFNLIFKNIITYLQNPITAIAYPFIDSKKVVFISEDTEYKYENMLPFSRLAKEYDINVTLFCVARLAKQYKDMTKEVSTYPNIEIGSHSYSHTKIMGTNEEKVKKEIVGSKEIIENIIGKKIYGFRPPREEIDKLMTYWLINSGYIYVMEKIKPYLLPKETSPNFFTIPRHGTDDYTYIIELDWNKNQILNKIIQETILLTKMNALYTLSVHTHLLSYKSNLDVSKRYFKYLNTQKDIKTLKGIDIAKRANILKNLQIKADNFQNKTTLKITNNSIYPIINGKFRIYHPNMDIKSITPELFQTKLKIINSNKEYSDVEISKIPPKTTTIIFIEY